MWVQMANNAAIENFIKKVRLAQTTKSKDIRITIEEAIDLVASIALINTNNDVIADISKQMKSVLKKLNDNTTSNISPHVDGGGFKV